MPDGIDVSKWQGTVDWSKVAGAGKEFAIARSSIASFTKDETFVTNYKGMVRAGLVPGAYHLVSGQSSGQAQAANWKSQLDAAGFDKGLLVLDVEGWAETTGFETATLEATEYLCNWIRSTYGRDPIIYTGVYWRESLKQHPNNFGSHLWLAAYVTDPTPYVPKAWQSWRIWQKTDSGSVAGITGNVDLNDAKGTTRALKSLAGWGWDELATQAEIRAVVADEVSKAVTNLQTSQGANADKVIASLLASLRDVEVRLSTDIAANKHGDVLTKQETLDKFTEILAAVSVPEDDSVEFASLAALIDNLHKHICTRVDLHA